MMLTTDKKSCTILTDILAAHGIRHVVMSPGSRNMPLMVAAHRDRRLTTTMVVDERVNGFMALGMAVATNRPVAIICTSGTALLNFAPAVAEAYYRHVPLIVVSADRPAAWIDQDDSQTMRQPGALTNITKLTVDISEPRSSEDIWRTNRQINDAILMATGGCKGPVHINIQLNEPLNGLTDITAGTERIIHRATTETIISAEMISRMAYTLANAPRVMVIAGFMQADDEVNQALVRLSHRPNTVVLTENISNQHSADFVECVDLGIREVTEINDSDMQPDIVITMGGALVSRFVKNYLRRYHPQHHWHVGVTRTTVDCMQSLSERVDTDARTFLKQILDVDTVVTESSYAEKWRNIKKASIERRNNIIARSPWTELKVFAQLLPCIPAHYDLHLSNGTPIRYAQLLADTTHAAHTWCNRGVSGIDGSTSTAIGSCMTSGKPTLLITGDTSAQYDMGALAVRDIPANFRMVVIDNSGGGIFRFIGSTRHLEERELLFGDPVNFQAKQLAKAYGFSYLEATN
ncbi:MAG: 2-succinyl-5-enolpyruvyl-6-hydroxy-3-cyclohexene-1-carboxylic-acid synthase, partial [Muribaculaceae bacterium]|nr:2-succinyl-5-enolpyruvyl-6-hydroxy-3-cyclohexene-1-carboxylic-acid synthase [Muribaculaceae bacterium]